jgi:prophage regulatory protein
MTKGTPFELRAGALTPGRQREGCLMSDKTPIHSTLEKPEVVIEFPALRHRVLFSRAQMYLMEAEGLFPMHIKLGRYRCVWVLREVIAWMQSKVDQRPLGDSDRVVVGPDDRFISVKELRTYGYYKGTHLARLEKAGKFPRRVKISKKRVAWLDSEIAAWLMRKRSDTNQAALSFSAEAGEVVCRKNRSSQKIF